MLPLQQRWRSLANKFDGALHQAGLHKAFLSLLGQSRHVTTKSHILVLLRSKTPLCRLNCLVVSSENLTLPPHYWYFGDVLFERLPSHEFPGRARRPKHSAWVLDLRGDVGDVGAADILVKRIDSALQVGKIGNVARCRLVFPEKAWLFGAIVVVLEVRLSFDETADAGVAQRAIKHLARVRRVHVLLVPSLLQ